MTLNDCLNYEITSSWIAGYISNKTLQNIFARYYIWKTKKKYDLYLKHLKYTELRELGK